MQSTSGTTVANNRTAVVIPVYFNLEGMKQCLVARAAHCDHTVRSRWSHSMVHTCAIEPQLNQPDGRWMGQTTPIHYRQMYGRQWD